MSATTDQAPVVPAAMIKEAAERVAGRVRRTPVIDWSVHVRDRWVDVTLKLELLQHVGSFKPRGAFNRILSASPAPELVVAASGGNHGLAVAYVARELGLRAVVYVPETVPQVKVDGIRALGAETILVGSSYAEAAEAATGAPVSPGLFTCTPTTRSKWSPGRGRWGWSSRTRRRAWPRSSWRPGAEAWSVVSPRGTAEQVVSVEPHGSPTMYAALARDGPVDVEVGGLASDSLGPAGPGRSGSPAPGLPV